MAKLITNKSNIFYLSNFSGSSGFMLLTRNKSYLFTDFRYIERAKNTIKKNIEIIDITKLWKNKEEVKKQWQKLLKKHRIKTLEIEEDNLTLTQFKKFKKISPKIKFKNISGKIENKREIKSKKEINLIKQSQRINEKIFQEIKKLIQNNQNPKSNKSLYEIELLWKIKELTYKYGAEDIAFEPIIAFGKNSSIPHHQANKTKLKKNDIVLIDMGVKYKNYCSDMTRTILPKNSTKKQQEIYNLVLKAQTEAIKKIKSGITGCKADFYSRAIINKAGYEENYGHAGGHGIGIDVHESPSLSKNYKKKLKINSIITIEPGIYLENEFGVRIEDMILITKNGNKNLTNTLK